jgi:YbbR domain-containing protein
VTISAKILNVKEVPIELSTQGTPYGNYRVVEISSTPDSVKLKGTSSVLNPIVSIAIPASVLDVSGAREDISTTIDISEYLPDGVELVDSSNTTVKVNVRIEAYKSKDLKIKSSDIDVKNLESGYKLSFGMAEIPVTISGLQADLDILKASDLVASVDASDLEAGDYKITLDLKIDEEKYAYWPISVEVHIEKESSKNDDQEDLTDNDEQN